MDRFSGTLLTKLRPQIDKLEAPERAFERMSEETDKALLDLLKKVNETSASAADAASTSSSLASINSNFKTAIKGMKYGLDVSYVSADVLTIIPGAVEVNGELVECPNALAITSSMANFPAAGAWAFITMKKDGTHRLFPATGAGTVRPTDACFQWAGGGVGFLDLGKQHYMYDADRVIIGAIHRVNATTWYTINLENGSNESGDNAYGSYQRSSDGTMIQWGKTTATTSATVTNRNIGTYGWSYYSVGVGVISFPVEFANALYRLSASSEAISHREYNKLTTSFAASIYDFQPSTTFDYEWTAIGRWRA